MLFDGGSADGGGRRPPPAGQLAASIDLYKLEDFLSTMQRTRGAIELSNTTSGIEGTTTAYTRGRTVRGDAIVGMLAPAMQTSVNPCLDSRL